MKIIVPVKQVIDTGARVRVKPDRSGIDLTGVRLIANPFDEIALEEAVRIKEAGTDAEIIAVTVGGPRTIEILRAALACGADRAVHIDHPDSLDPLGVAKLLAALVRREGARLVIAGKQSIDGDGSQIGPMLAALLGWPQATFASSVTLGEGEVTVTREVDAGLQTQRLPLPAVITADLRLNTPRYASLPNVMKAKKKPLEALTAAELGVEPVSHLFVLETREPESRPKGMMVGSVDELLGKLRNEAKVI